MTDPTAAIGSVLRQALEAHRAGRLFEAEQLYRAVLAASPDNLDALLLLGLLFGRRGNHEAALRHFIRAIAIDPRSAPAQLNAGNALQLLKRPAEALAHYDAAVRAAPDLAEAHLNRGNVLRDLHRAAEALASYDTALRLTPELAGAYVNRGVALQDLGRHQDAIDSYTRALALAPGDAQAHNNRGFALLHLGRSAEAVADFERVLGIDPAFPYVRGKLFHARMLCCDWRNYDAERARITAEVRAGARASLPLMFGADSGVAADQLRCTATYVRDNFPPRPPLWRGERYRHDRIRLAYLSADFDDHATAALMAGLFERHDPERFQTMAISFGPQSSGAMRRRLMSAFEDFLDVREKNGEEIARLLREREVDIAVDLKGFTYEARPEILAARPAPVQIHYLGYPGTMAAPFIDYLVADRVVIPESAEADFTEKIVYLPDTYQVNDTRRQIAERTPARGELGLPETGFVFCCFNSAYKITPFMFAIWMRLLKAVPGSVLWLFVEDAAAADNLRAAAAGAGVAPERLVFAPRMASADHLARYRRADLFLDTLHYNAHTTASDALWAGLPVLTCLGQTFAGRVAASLLHAAGLPELIAESLADYETAALALASEPARLAALKARLAANRATCALFDTDRFRRHIEAAYEMMWQRYQRGEPPASFAVAPIG